MKREMLVVICVFAMLTASIVHCFSPKSNSTVTAQTTTPTWHKTFSDISGTGQSKVRSIVETTDGGYAITVDSYQYGPYYSVLLVKLDSEGNLQWNKVFTEEHTIWASSIVQTDDGGYALAGTRIFYPENNYTRFIWFTKTDSQGNTQWTKTYGDEAGISEGRAMVQTSDGGYIVAGNYYDKNTQGRDGLLTKIDSAGNLQWSRTYSGGIRDERFYSVVQTSDGGYAMAGKISLEGNIQHFWLVKADSSGVMEWNETYISAQYTDAARSLVQTSDGGYTVAGITKGENQLVGSSTGGHTVLSNNVGNFWLVKTDPSGAMEWNTAIGYDTRGAQQIIQTKDGGYAIAGSGNLNTSYNRDTAFGLVKTDSSGRIQWTYGGESTNAYVVIQTRDDGYVLAGHILKNNHDIIWVTKIGPNGEAPTSTQTPAPSATPTPTGQQNTVFLVSSNSTVTEFSFDSQEKTVSFQVTGPPGTSGYVGLHIPKSLITDPADLQVYIDGKTLTYTYQSQSDAWIVTVTYNHSTHQINVNLNAETPFTSEYLSEQWLTCITVVIATVIVTAALLTWRKKEPKLKRKT
jgi:hypothetical protein